MAERTSSLKPAGRSKWSDIDGQLWPTVCATLVLAGILGVVVYVNSDFEDDRLLWNGYTHAACLGVAAVFLITLASRMKHTARRTAELAIVLSLALHAVAGVGAFYLFTSPVGALGVPQGVREASAESDDDTPPPDYHWGQDDDQQEPEQAFEKAVATAIREQTPPAAKLQPRNTERPTPAADLPKAAKLEISPLGVGGTPEPSRPLDIRRPDAAQGADAKTSEALAMVRQKPDAVPLPKSEAPVPVAMPELPHEKPQVPMPAAVQAEKVDWAAVASKAARANDEPIPPPHKLARVEVQPGESPAAPQVIARLPAEARPQAPSGGAGSEADRIAQQGSTLERSDRDGLPLPSAVVPDAGLPAQSPAAMGNSQPSRLEAVSTVPVEKSNTSRAPLGPTIASNGSQDWGTGSSLLPTRRGALDGRGRAQPSIEGNSTEDPAEIRAGSPGSTLSQGVAMPAAPARRAIASQTDDAGSGSSAGQAARLPRTQSDLGLERPAAARIVDDVAVAGAGGTASLPGGQTSTLDVGARISLRRSTAAGALSDLPRGGNGAGSAEGLPGNDMLAQGSVGPAAGLAHSGPRRIEQGMPTGDEIGSGVGRARPEIFAPRPALAPAGPLAGTAGVSTAPSPGGTSLGGGVSALGPSAGLGGIGRRDVSGQGVGSRPAGQMEPSELAAATGITAPQALGAPGRGVHGDSQLDALLSSGSGPGGAGRGSSPVVVSGQVHEPMEPFRRGAVHGGLTLGDSAQGQLTEPAIENGLEFFTRTQFPDGHWSLHELPPGIPSDAATLGELHADTAATGLALLTYLGAGYTHQDEKYRDTIRRGVEWLVKHQQANGGLSYRGSSPTHFYSQGIATMALCECYGMTQDRELREPAQKAIDFIVQAQDSRRGGWRYNPQDGSDTSVTGWQLMALKSAQMAGLKVPEDALRQVGHWLDLAQVPNRGTYVYNPWNLDTEDERRGREPNPTMTAQAMIMRMYLGQDHDKATLGQGADYVLAHLPDPETQQSTYRDCYYWYYATQAMYHMQGDYWTLWDARVSPLLRAGQIDRGPLKGSWSPREPVPDRWSAHGGRHYVTSMHVLTLEFRYWHLPLFRELRKDE